MLGLVTAEVAVALDPDLIPLFDALVDRVGAERVRVVSWDDVTVDWSLFDAVIIRSTWDYTERLAEFLVWVDRVDALTTLVNPADVIRWSTDKRYLAELAEGGIPIIPTLFVAPGEPVPTIEADAGIHVVKPTVGAGSSGARRCEAHEVADHVALLHSDGRTAMIQPYLELLDTRGETALCFVPGVQGSGLSLSHAFRKGAILTSVDVEQTGDLFATEQIRARTPSPEEVGLAQSVLDTEVVRSMSPLTFARVDIAPWRDSTGVESYVLMELELIEPSFYFSERAPNDDDPTAQFADRLLAALAASGVFTTTTTTSTTEVRDRA